jgi:hypothetical protein
MASIYLPKKHKVCVEIFVLNTFLVTKWFITHERGFRDKSATVKLLSAIKGFFYNVFTKSTGKIQCRYEAPREEPREAHDYLVLG